MTDFYDMVRGCKITCETCGFSAPMVDVFPPSSLEVKMEKSGENYLLTLTTKKKCAFVCVGNGEHRIYKKTP